MARDRATASWTSAWPDGLAFAAGLGVAWWGAWTAADLVWSLWLSSLVVGYSMIVWKIIRPGVVIARGAWRDRLLVRQAMAEHGGASAAAAGVTLGSIMLIGGLVMLAFFTVHFGGFHYVHSQFLAMFFPIDEAGSRGMTGMATYVEVVRRYWWFLPAAFLAQRAAFQLEDRVAVAPDTSVTAAAIAARKAAAGMGGFGSGMMAPYREVVRMHMLIFFFAFASFAALDNFAVYAVVYAVYFFPWRLVRREGAGALAAGVPTRS